MDVKTIATVGKRLKRFLSRFSDCFSRSEPREHLGTYVEGQVSGLQRKSVEPMALNGGTPPRTLQRFLESGRWDEQRLRDKMQWVVAAEHGHPKAVGVVDESAVPKCGKHTACVERQWCGNKGKVDNCVVGVHTSYVAEEFQCILDSELYMPKSWADDLPRRRLAHIPDNVQFRTKPEIALGQVARALENGVRVGMDFRCVLRTKQRVSGWSSTLGTELCRGGPCRFHRVARTTSGFTATHAAGAS